MKTRFALTAGAALAAAGLASAGTMTYSGAGTPIPHPPSTGDDDGSAFVETTISVPDSFNVTNVTVTLKDLQHTWAGDLQITLIHEDSGASVDLVDRVGRTGGTGFGDSSEYGGDYSFDDGFSGDLWSEAAGVGFGEIIPGGDYFPTTTDGAASSLAVFNGLSAMSDWTLRITDWAGGDVGELGAWNLTLEGEGQIIPTPAAAGLGAFGLLGLAGRRRRANI